MLEERRNMLTRRVITRVRGFHLTGKMADLNLKNIRAAYRDRSEGLNDQGEQFEFLCFVFFFVKFYSEIC